MEALEEVKEAIKDAHKRHPETHPSIEHSAWILKEEMAELRDGVTLLRFVKKPVRLLLLLSA